MATFWERAANSVDHCIGCLFYVVVYVFWNICIFCYFPFGVFKGGIWALIAPVPINCILVNF